jgi:hypothetical protein
MQYVIHGVHLPSEVCTPHRSKMLLLNIHLYNWVVSAVLQTLILMTGAWGSVVVKALRY